MLVDERLGGDYSFKLKLDLEMKTLMIVDDEAALRDILVDMFAADFTILEASDGEEAIERVKQKVPDIILTDISMPKMNGIEFVSELRRTGIRAPVIFITAHGDKTAAIAAVRLQAVDFVEKPFEPAMLYKSVHTALKANAAEAQTLSERLQTLGYSRRQIEILELVAQGASNKDIASNVHITEKGVKYHIGRFFKDFSVDNRRELQIRLGSPKIAI